MNAAVSRLAPVVLVLSLPACSLFEDAAPLFGSGAQMTETELRSRVVTFADRFARAVQGAADEIASRSPDAALQREALVWKMSLIGECREAAARPDPRGALSDCWTLCVQLRRSLEGEAPLREALWTEPGAVETARRAVSELESDVAEVAVEWLGKSRFDAAAAEIEAFAAANPIEGRFGRRSYDRPALAGREFPRVEAIVSAGLAPFDVVGGIDRTAQSIQDFSDVADRFTQVVEALPERARWEAQLALYDLEDRRTVVATRDAVVSLADSADRLVATAEALPDALRETLTRSFADVDASSRSLRETAAAFDGTVAEARRLVADVDGALLRSSETVTAAGAAADDVARAGEAWEGVARAVAELVAEEDPPGARAESEPAGEPFDVGAYGDAADRVARAAAELRAGLVELRAVMESADVSRVTAAVDASTEAALRRTSERAEELVDHVTGRAALLAGLVFVLATAFTLLTRRWK